MGVDNVSNGVDIKKLLESGAHFGHSTSRWHPKMAPYLHSKRDGSHIIDLATTVVCLEKATEFIEKTTKSGKQVLIVGTKRQAKDAVKQVATQTHMPYVNERWVGGMLTNVDTIGSRIKRLKDFEQKMESGYFASKFNKLEIQRFQEEIDEMNHLYGGIKNMDVKLGAVFVADVNNDINAVREARKLGVPVVAIVDSNADPSLVDFPIPANDDAIKSVALILNYIEQAIQFGKAGIKEVKEKSVETVKTGEEK
ncbi:30S ribosomal protein S2 [Candidatus Saccharibacteria bacterium RIFCSPHIGHO2_12_FULL_41_12]|nr:MAG: 30S ribosomal protein S2 [Candidatus Saccharibacteria bacterium RIFCSPHIGHO2_12_FULL_41_12]